MTRCVFVSERGAGDAPSGKGRRTRRAGPATPSPMELDSQPGTRFFQPRFVAYARSQGRDPEAQLAHDMRKWPGGCMAGFMIWTGQRLAEFRELSPESFMAGGGLIDQSAWSAYTEGWSVDHAPQAV